MKKALPWIALIFAVLWIIHNPAGAAAEVRALINGASTFAAGL